MVTVLRTESRPYPERFARRVTIQASLEMPPSLVVQVWMFARDADLRCGDGSEQGYEQHLAVLTGTGWVEGDVARRPIRPGDVVVSPSSGSKLTISTDNEALSLLSVSWDTDEHGAARVVDGAVAGDPGLLAQVDTPIGFTVRVCSIAAGVVLDYSAGRPAATSFIVLDGSGRVDDEPITRGDRVPIPASHSARITADSALTLLVVE